MTRVLERLAELCAIDSPTGDTDADDACARLLARWAGQAGAEVELLPSPDGLHLVARTPVAARGRVAAARPPRHGLRRAGRRRCARCTVEGTARSGLASPT